MCPQHRNLNVYIHATLIIHFHSLGKPLWSFHVGSRLSLALEWYNFENILSFFPLFSFFCCRCCCSVTQSYPILCNTMDCIKPGFLPCLSPSPWACSNSCPLSRWCHSTISTSVLSYSSCLQFFTSGPFPMSRLFSDELDLCIRWSKYWNFRGRISPSNEYSEFISFRTDWFDLLAVQVTPKSLLQHHSSKYEFFSAQLILWSNSHTCTWLLEKS